MYNSYLRALIKNSGTTQKDFARLLGIPNSALSNIITGNNVASKNTNIPSFGIQKRYKGYQQLIADYFNQPVKQIF